MADLNINTYTVARKPAAGPDTEALKSAILGRYLEIMAIEDEVQRAAAGIEFVRSLSTEETSLLGVAMEERKEGHAVATFPQYQPEPEDELFFDDEESLDTGVGEKIQADAMEDDEELRSNAFYETEED